MTLINHEDLPTCVQTSGLQSNQSSLQTITALPTEYLGLQQIFPQKRSFTECAINNHFKIHLKTKNKYSSIKFEIQENIRL